MVSGAGDVAESKPKTLPSFKTNHIPTSLSSFGSSCTTPSTTRGATTRRLRSDKDDETKRGEGCQISLRLRKHPSTNKLDARNFDSHRPQIPQTRIVHFAWRRRRQVGCCCNVVRSGSCLKGLIADRRRFVVRRRPAGSHTSTSLPFLLPGASLQQTRR